MLRVLHIRLIGFSRNRRFLIYGLEKFIWIKRERVIWTGLRYMAGDEQFWNMDYNADEYR